MSTKRYCIVKNGKLSHEKEVALRQYFTFMRYEPEIHAMTAPESLGDFNILFINIAEPWISKNKALEYFTASTWTNFIVIYVYGSDDAYTTVKASLRIKKLPKVFNSQADWFDKVQTMSVAEEDESKRKSVPSESEHSREGSVDLGAIKSEYKKAYEQKEDVKSTLLNKVLADKTKLMHDAEIYKTRIAKLEGDMQLLVLENDKKEKAMHAMLAKAEELKKQSDLITRDATTRQAAQEAVVSVSTEQKMELAALKAKVDDYSKKNSVLVAKVTEFDATVSKLTSELQTMRAQHAALKAQHIEALRDKQILEASKRAETLQLPTTTSSNDLEIADLQAKFKRLQADYDVVLSSPRTPPERKISPETTPVLQHSPTLKPMSDQSPRPTFCRDGNSYIITYAHGGKQKISFSDAQSEAAAATAASRICKRE